MSTASEPSPFLIQDPDVGLAARHLIFLLASGQANNLRSYLPFQARIWRDLRAQCDHDRKHSTSSVISGIGLSFGYSSGRPVAFADKAALWAVIVIDAIWMHDHTSRSTGWGFLVVCCRSLPFLSSTISR